MPNANTPKPCKLVFAENNLTVSSHLTKAEGLYSASIYMPEMSIGKVDISWGEGNAAGANLSKVKILPEKSLWCEVEFTLFGQLGPIGFGSLKPGDQIYVVFENGERSHMSVHDIGPETIVARFKWPSMHTGSRVKAELPNEPEIPLVIRSFKPVWDENKSCHLNLEFASERKWGIILLYLILAIGALSAAFWVYKFSNVGGADKTTTITPTPPMVCVPATPHNVRSFYLQKDPRRFMGKVSHLPEPFMSFACPTPPPYDQASKTSDVSACEICFPQAYAKPGAAFKMDEGMLQSMFFQKDPQCFMDPVLPFKPSAETMRKALRVDLDCQDYSFNGSMGCWDYSKCNLIMPNYETTKPPTAK